MVVATGRFWVVDVEGNGGSPPQIVEMAMLEINDLRLTGKQLHWLIRPDEPIQPAVTRIHGLTDADVADAPSIEDIADDALTWLDSAVIVGHNVRVELETLTRSFPDWRPAAAVDTLRLARTLRPGLESYSLGKLAISLKVTAEFAKSGSRGEHSALYDATLTALIFIDLVTAVPEEQRNNVLNEANILDQRQGTFL
jgi:DNA polymerase III epsilon subunit family exonuclease